MKIRYINIKKTIFFILIFLWIVIIITGCGYQLYSNFNQNKINGEDHIKKLTILLKSYDPFGTLTRIIKNELYLNHIKIFNSTNSENMKIYTYNTQDIPCLDILNTSINHITTSVYRNGTESEYRLLLTVQTQLFIPNKKKYFPINIYVNRTFIKKTTESLSDIIQENEITEDMYRDAAQKLIQQSLTKLIYE